MTNNQENSPEDGQVCWQQGGIKVIKPDDFCFRPVEKSYIKMVFIRICLVYIILMACAPLILLAEAKVALPLLISAESVLAISFVINLAFARKIYAFKGYMTGENDISYRSGIFFSSITTIPYCKIQQVSVRLNPLSRIFGLYYLDVINGSQTATNSITIPGLTREDAEGLKSLIMANICRDDE